jgi:tetraacyldisaccharide 4'-kinase
VLAIAGIADPASFGAQLEDLGARVALQDWPDHHAFTVRDVSRVRRAAGSSDVVVLTLKDAVKLRAIWPADLPEPLIANLGVRWERGRDQVERALHELTIHHGGSR